LRNAVSREDAHGHGDTAFLGWGLYKRHAVLVVDDEPTFRDAARRLLERRGYAVVAEAGCGATALDAVERFAPQAVPLDVRLGEDDGFEVCRSVSRSAVASYARDPGLRGCSPPPASTTSTVSWWRPAAPGLLQQEEARRN
jgi:PleD family two-component response regulator